MRSSRLVLVAIIIIASTCDVMAQVPQLWKQKTGDATKIVPAGATPYGVEATSGLAVVSATAEPLRVNTSAASGRTVRLESTSLGSISMYDGATLRTTVGYGSAGHIFSTALTNSTAIRSESALHFGTGSSLSMTIREVGYGPGNGYICVGGETDPLTVFEVGGEASPELGIRSNTTGSRWTLQSNADGTLNIIDRTQDLERLKIGAGGDVSLSTSAAWYRGINAASVLQPLIRSRGLGYSVSTYPGVQVGQAGDHISLFIDPASISGGTFTGNSNEVMLPNLVRFIQANAGGTDWKSTAGTIALDDGNLVVYGPLKFAGTNSTGAGTAMLGANSPASTLTAPYTWVSVTTSDGSSGFIPVWK